jgi:hypothetical protein
MQALTILHACEFYKADIIRILPLALCGTAVSAPTFLLSIKDDKLEQRKVVSCTKGDDTREVKNDYLGKIATLTQVNDGCDERNERMKV